MSDFDPVTLFFIVHESLGAWLWLLLGMALALLVGLVTSARGLRRAGQPMARPALLAVIVGLVVAVAATFATPLWTLADFGALDAAVDYVVAFLFALIPGAAAAAVVFVIAARQRSSSRAAGRFAR